MSDRLNDIPGNTLMLTESDIYKDYRPRDEPDALIKDDAGNMILSNGTKGTVDDSTVIDEHTPWHYRCIEFPSYSSDYIEKNICHFEWVAGLHWKVMPGANVISDDKSSRYVTTQRVIFLSGNVKPATVTIVGERGYNWGEIAVVDDIADWARKGEEPPSPGGHPDYIEDNEGHKITAAGKFTETKEVLQWKANPIDHETEAEHAFMVEMDEKLIGWEPIVSSDVVTNFPSLPTEWTIIGSVKIDNGVILVSVSGPNHSDPFAFVQYPIQQTTEKALVRSVNGAGANEDGDVISSDIIDLEGNMISADRTYKKESEPVTRDTPWTYSYKDISKTEEEFSGSGASITWKNSSGLTPGDAWRIVSNYEIVVSTDELATDVTYKFANTGPYIDGTEYGVPVIVHATRGGNVEGKLALQSDIADWAKAGQQKPGGMSFVGFALKDCGLERGDKLTIGDYTYDGSTINVKIDIVDSDKMDVGHISTFNEGQFREGEVVFVPAPQDYENAGKIITFKVGGCLAEDTLILMADGTSRKVRDIRAGDKVLCVNPHSLLLDEDEVAYSDGAEDKTHDVTDVWTFSDGTVLKTVLPHEFFNVRTGCMEYIADFRIGDGVRKSDGSTVELVSHEQVNGPVRHNTLFTRKWNNYFAAGILTGNRESVKWGWHWLEEHNEAK